jgi:hypothetical protein
MKPTLTLLRKELLQGVRRHGEAGLAEPLDMRRCGSPRARAGFTPNRVRTTVNAAKARAAHFPGLESMGVQAGRSAVQTCESSVDPPRPRQLGTLFTPRTPPNDNRLSTGRTIRQGSAYSVTRARCGNWRYTPPS